MRRESACLYGTGFKDLILASFTEGKRISAFIIDMSMVQTGCKYVWIWITIEPVHNSVLGIHISEERNMFLGENFIHSLVDKYGKHKVYTDGDTWYPQAYTSLHLKHRLHSPLEKSLIE